MKIYIWALIIVVALGALYFYSKNKDLVVKSDDSLACYSFTSVEGDIKDEYSLKLSVKGEKAEGELKFMPEEKDSKIGSFEGLVSPVDPNSSSRIIAAWWETKGEGIDVREQLAILLGDEIASIGFGEMVKSENGDYLYADPAKVSYFLTLSKVDCLTI